MIIEFPRRRFRDVRIEREADGDGWLVVARSHAWLHGDRHAAMVDAHEIARGFGAAIVSSAGRVAP